MENKQIKVLVVEDEIILQNLIYSKLVKRNFSVVYSRTAAQALKYLEDNKDIDIIWLDHYLLGNDDGLDFVAKVKENPDWKNIPIFLISNSASDEKVQAYFQLGVDKYFVKSNYTLDNIIDDMEKYVSEREHTNT